MKRYLLVFLFMSSIPLWGIENHPWFGPDKLFQFETGYGFEHYSHIEINGQTKHIHSTNHLLPINAAVSPDPSISLDAGMLVTDTSSHNFSLDNWHVRARCILFDNLVGDPATVAFGFTFTRTSAPGLRDISTFHSGKMNYETHLTLGKESSCGMFWTYRLWTLIGGGIADRGSPWVRTQLGWKKNYCDCFDYGIILKGLWGFGERNLDLNGFRGYGPICHRSVDLCLQLSYDLLEWGKATLEYACRPWATNYPKRLQGVHVSLLYPFAI